MKLYELREDYNKGELGDGYFPENPMIIFEKWMNDAINPKNTWTERIKNWIVSKLFGTLIEPNAMTLSTVDPSGKPNSRTVLLKGVIDDTLQFFTNYDSQKAYEIDHNNHVSCTFWWPPLQRQVIVRGTASKLSTSENDEYFNSRPRKSQIGAHASNQSRQIRSRSELEKSYIEMKDVFKNTKTKDIPRPDNWGGYNIHIRSIEFWQGRSGRLHDRIRYNKNEILNGRWEWIRVSP